MICTVIVDSIISHPELTVAIILSLILAIVLAIILAVILFFVWRIRITIEAAEEKVFVNVWAFGIKIPIWPRKPKKYRIGRYTLKKIAKRDQKEALRQAKKEQKKAEEKKAKQAKKGEAKKKTADKKEKSGSEDFKKFYREYIPHPADSLDYITGLIRFFFPTVLSHVHFHAARIRIKVGGPDAASIALRNTAIHAALIPALAFIERHSNLHGLKRADVDVSPDYLSEEIKYDVKLGFSMSTGALALIMIRSLIRVFFGYLKIKPKTVNDSSESSKKSPQATRKPTLKEQIGYAAEQSNQPPKT